MKTRRWLNFDPDCLAGPSREGTPRLTGRQREVLRLVAAGLLNKQIAGVLGISKNTVDNHVRALLSRLDAANRQACVRIARQRGLL